MKRLQAYKFQRVPNGEKLRDLRGFMPLRLQQSVGVAEREARGRSHVHWLCNVLARRHRVLAYGEPVPSGRSAKQEPAAIQCALC
jgi:hypothetical protein